MARKVFISILGTGFYGSCQYASGSFTSTKTRFVQEATLECIGAKDWTEQDTAFIFLTKKAQKDNWSKSIMERMHPITKSKESYIGLEKLLENMELQFVPEGVDIDDGKDENEMWGIFNKIYEKIKEGDELYFDLTHSFRYLPMLLLVLGNYSKFLKNVKIVHISYGNYEARNEDTNIAPFVNLLPIAALQDWTSSAASFINNGDVSQIVNLCKQTLNPILRNNLHEDTEQARNLDKYSSRLKTIVSDIYGCRGLSIIKGNDFKNLFKAESHLNEIMIEPMRPIVRKLKDSFSEFKPEQNIMNGYFAAKWCLEHNLVQQALTLFQENIVSHICGILHDINLQDENERELVNKAFNFYSMNKPKEKWRVGESDIPIIETIMQNPLLKQLSPIFSSTTGLRNDYNHAGMRYNPTSLDNIKTNLQKCIQQLFEIIKKSNPDIFNNNDILSETLLINLSNHPSANWKSEQLVAAESFGEIVDLPFPEVSPDGDEEYIQSLCNEYVEKIMQIVKDKKTEKTAVHVMGEMTLTFSLVYALQTEGFTCVASTSERIITDKGNGSKEVQFVFNRFREYELMTKFKITDITDHND
jgi:CRISPR-associated Csx2 family protein